MKAALQALAAILLFGYGSIAGGEAMRFSEYTGHDASSFFGTWPIGPGTMAEGVRNGGLFTTSLVVPIYRGWPEKHYKVLGSLRFKDPNKDWGYDEGLLKAAAREAKRHGADAIIIRQGAEFGVSQIAGARRNDLSVLSTYQTTALAIRWLTAQEIEERTRLLKENWDRFTAERRSKQKAEFRENPNMGANLTVAELVITFLFVSGDDFSSPHIWRKFDEIMAALATHAPETPSGTWIFKATANLSTALSENGGRNSLGLATVSMDGGSLTIVSSSGQIELNFNGTLEKGRLSGQLGIGAAASKCEGAYTPEKISISFQSPSPDGVLTGNVVLQRLPPDQNDNQLQRLPFNPKQNEKGKSDSATRGA